MINYVYNQFKQSSRTRLLNAINQANTTALTDDDVTFSPPQWSFETIHDTNTKVTVIAYAPSTVQGQAEFYYKRHAIGELFDSTVPTNNTTSIMTRSVDLLESIAERYRVRLDREDVIDEVLPSLSASPTAYTLKMSEHSLGWVGDLKLDLRPVTVILDTRITNPYGAIADFTPAPGATRSELWLGPRRLVSQADVAIWLDETPLVNAGLTSWMIEQIRTYYGPEWSSVPELNEANNLYTATIAYVGPNTAEVGIPGSAEDVVVMIRLGPYCTNYTGFLIFSLPEHMVRAYHDA